MKRMSDVFNLPLSAEVCGNEPSLADSEYYFASFDDELSYSDGLGLERAKHAAHAINHVDALADALDNLINASESSSAWYNKEHKEAVLALTAYLGEK